MALYAYHYNKIAHPILIAFHVILIQTIKNAFGILTNVNKLNVNIYLRQFLIKIINNVIISLIRALLVIINLIVLNYQMIVIYWMNHNVK